MTTPADVYAANTPALARALSQTVDYKVQRDELRRQRVAQLINGIGQAAKAYDNYQTEQEDKKDSDAFSSAVLGNSPQTYLDYVKNTPAQSSKVAQARNERVMKILAAHSEAQQMDIQKAQEGRASATFAEQQKLFPYQEAEAKAKSEREVAQTEEYKSTGALRKKKMEADVAATEQEGALRQQDIAVKGIALDKYRKQDLAETYAARILNDPENAFLHEPTLIGKELSSEALDAGIAQGKVKKGVGPIWEEALQKVREQLTANDENRIKELGLKDSLTNRRAEKYISANMDKWHQKGATIAQMHWQNALSQVTPDMDIAALDAVRMQTMSKINDTINQDSSLEDGTDLGMYKGRAKTEALEQAEKELNSRMYSYMANATKEKSPDEKMIQMNNFLNKQYEQGFIDRNGVRRSNPAKDPMKMMDKKAQMEYDKAFQDTFSGQLRNLNSAPMTPPSNPNTSNKGQSSIQQVNDSSDEETLKILKALSDKYK